MKYTFVEYHIFIINKQIEIIVTLCLIIRLMNIAFLFNHRSQRVTVLRQCTDVLAYKRDERKIMIPIYEIYFCEMLLSS